MNYKKLTPMQKINRKNNYALLNFIECFAY